MVSGEREVKLAKEAILADIILDSMEMVHEGKGSTAPPSGYSCLPPVGNKGTGL